MLASLKGVDKFLRTCENDFFFHIYWRPIEEWMPQPGRHIMRHPLANMVDQALHSFCAAIESYLRPYKHINVLLQIIMALQEISG